MNALFSEQIQADGILYKHARGASDRSGKEFHTFHEIVLFLGDKATFISEKIHTEILPNTLIVIPKESYHQFIIHGDPNSYYRCVLHFDDSEELLPLITCSLREITFAKAGRKLLSYYETLNTLTKEPSPHRALVLKSVLTLLLNELTIQESTSQQGESQNPVVCQAISYINKNIDQALPIERISRECHLSPSSLSHLFKKEMKISLHQFILKKRLIIAYHKIATGQAPTSVAIECGFHDYSGFYKQYKKMFGRPPSNK